MITFLLSKKIFQLMTVAYTFKQRCAQKYLEVEKKL